MNQVVKRNGTKEPYDIEKIHRLTSWAVEGLADVSQSDIEINANLNIIDGITTDEIHSVLVESAANLISEEYPDYQYVAGRLLNYQIRKEVWGGKNPPKLIDLIKKNIESGYYTPAILEWYTTEELHKIDEFINHEQDFEYTYCSVKQLCDKYLVKNRHTKEMYETPQFRYIVASLTIFHKYEGKKRLQYIKKAYNAFNKFKINLATPQLSGLGTNNNSYASCCLIEMLDTADSITATISTVSKATCAGYGIGVNFGRMRGINSPIKNGTVIHPGLLPFMKILESTVKAWQKSGIRGGSATTNVPIWHSEIETVVQLKNANTGTNDNRIFNLDYAIGMSKLFYDRFIKNENITLFSPSDVPGLYDVFGTERFDSLYMEYENDKNIKSKSVSARELLSLLVKERLETGRIYIFNVDNVNQYGSWNDVVSMTNLCVSPETTILTKIGHEIISELDGETVEVWNGKDWSESTVLKTGENQKLLKVALSDGKTLEVTPYHKWYTVDSYNNQRKGKYTEKRTWELKDGDKLIKFDVPVIDGEEDFVHPYTHGFFTGDGHYRRGNPEVYLYLEKKKLIPFIDNLNSNYNEDPSGRIRLTLPRNLRPKFDVPLKASVDNKLRWLEGFLDADGTVVNTDGNESLQVASVEPVFLKEVQLMLQTLGVNAKIVASFPIRETLLPDGKGGYKMYHCKESKRIIITSNGLYQLSLLGFSPHRLQFSHKKPQRDASQFVRVVSVIDEGRYSDTYCVNEPREHKAVFNGILTGNCVEVTQNINPLKDINDPDSEIGVCVLSAINWLSIKNDKDFEETADIVVRMLDEIIDIQDYFDTAARNFCQGKRSLGIGVTNLAAFLAKNKLAYSDQKSVELVGEWMEKQQYYLVKASSQLASEKGVCSKFHTSKYSTGWLPIDKIFKDGSGRQPSMDWESLRMKVRENGMRHTTLTCQMPTESSSTSQNVTNGIEPIRSLITFKSSKKSSIPFVVPNLKTYGKYYETAFSMKNNFGYLNIANEIQKYMDMAMSVNQYFNPSNFEDGKISYSQILKEMIHFYKGGGKSLYYLNTDDKSVHFEKDSNCAGGACTL